jgi:hypothetical protein
MDKIYLVKSLVVFLCVVCFFILMIDVWSKYSDKLTNTGLRTGENSITIFRNISKIFLSNNELIEIVLYSHFCTFFSATYLCFVILGLKNRK